MEFHLKFNVPESDRKITFTDKLIFVGSCFSDEISALAKQHGFHVLANNFGTLFHPLAIAQNILDSLRDNKQMNIVQNDDVFLDYSCSGKVFGMSEGELRDSVISLRNDFKFELKNAAYLFVTFGTAYAYHLNENQQVVGNCHKQPSKLFSKKLTEISTIVSVWKDVVSELKRINPDIKICFSVSPVRHIKDGLHENNISKSSLMMAVDQLQQDNSISYFPAFELVTDVLRDYRFFKEDLVHPNQQAIQYVWGKFMETFFSSETTELATQVNNIKISQNHRLLYPKSQMASIFSEQLEDSIRKLKQANSQICWE